MIHFSGGITGPKSHEHESWNTCKSATSRVFLTLSYCAHYVSARGGSGNLNGIVHVTITKEALRIVAYSNEEPFFLSFFSPSPPLCISLQSSAGVQQRDRMRCSLSLCVSTLGSLTSAPGMNIREVAAEKTGCMGPCTQPACGAA